MWAALSFPQILPWFRHAHKSAGLITQTVAEKPHGGDQHFQDEVGSGPQACIPDDFCSPRSMCSPNYAALNQHAEIPLPPFCADA